MLNQLSFADLILGNAHDRECQESCCESFNERLRREGRERLKVTMAVKGDLESPTFAYVDNRTPVDLICGHCGSEFQKTPSTYNRPDFIGGCKGCAGTARRVRVAREKFEALMRKNGDRPGSNYNYVNTQVPVSIFCGKCRTESIKSPNAYNRKADGGCIVCAGQCPVTAKKNFIARVLENGDIMGDRFEYINTQTRVYLTCGVCDREFDGVPNDYMRDRMSCPRCRNRCPIEAQKDLERKIVERGDSKADDYCYIDSREKVSILCGKCGVASMRWPQHYRGTKSRCDNCDGQVARSLKALEDAIAERGDSKSTSFNYVDTRVKVDIDCGKCGETFSMLPFNYRYGQPCRCEQASAKAFAAFGEALDDRGDTKADDFRYIDVNTTVNVNCGKCKSVFRVTPYCYRSGQGCPDCTPGGFNPLAPSILYYVAFYPTPDRVVYKIGITNRTVEARYRSFGTPHETIWTEHFEDGYECREVEQRIIKEYAQYRCKDKPVNGVGNRELFDRDIMQGAKIRMTG